MNHSFKQDHQGCCRKTMLNCIRIRRCQWSVSHMSNLYQAISTILLQLQDKKNWITNKCVVLINNYQGGQHLRAHIPEKKFRYSTLFLKFFSPYRIVSQISQTQHKVKQKAITKVGSINYTREWSGLLCTPCSLSHNTGGCFWRSS